MIRQAANKPTRLYRALYLDDQLEVSRPRVHKTPKYGGSKLEHKEDDEEGLLTVMDVCSEQFALLLHSLPSFSLQSEFF